MLPYQKVKVRWNVTNRDYYISKGYKFTNLKEEFMVDVNDLSNNSKSFVVYICDYCNGKNQLTEKDKQKQYSSYKLKRNKLQKDCCNHVDCRAKKSSELKIKNDPNMCLAFKFPEIAKEWSDKNDDFPEEYTIGSSKVVWWKCPNGHEYQQKISNRTYNNYGCSICSGKRVSVDNCLMTVYPELCDEWNYEKNIDISPYEVTRGSKKIVWWKGKCGHEWEDSVDHRANSGRKCPYCSGKRVNNENCLATLRPDIAEQWHYIKNKDLTPYDVTLFSSKSVWWVCEKGHEWQTLVSTRTSQGSGCPYCSHNIVTEETSLLALYPDVALSWHYEKNKDLTPSDVLSRSGKKVWWKCEKGHEWKATISGRTSGNGCPYCDGKKVCNDNCLATLYPKVADSWNYEKNNRLTPHDVTSRSSKKVWWICSEGHEWETSISVRTSGRGCPICNESKGESAIREYLERNNVKFEQQFEFENLLGVRNKNLRFDFAILNDFMELTLLIEYDGEFHFKKIHKDHNLKTQQIHDKRKNNYCKTNDIPLLRISYKEFNNIEQILSNELNKYNLIIREPLL